MNRDHLLVICHTSPIGTFEVHTGSLSNAAKALWKVAGGVSDVRDAFGPATHGVGAVCGDAETGAAFDVLGRRWSAVLVGLTTTLENYEHDTETAAMLYERAERAAMPSTPPPVHVERGPDGKWPTA
jgi:hypothetical protein